MDWLDFLGRVAPILAALCAVAGALGGWIASARHSRSRREAELAERIDAIAKGTKVFCRSRVVDAYERHVTHGAPLTVERRSEVTQAYEAYRELGGNGTITRLYEELSELPTHIVGGGEES